MFSKILTAAIAAGAIAIGGLALTAAPASAYNTPTTDNVDFAYPSEGADSHAKGAKGGIYLGYASCVDDDGDYHDPTELHVKITGTGSDISRSYYGEEDVSNAYLIRVYPGSYDVELDVTCADGYSDSTTDYASVGRLKSSQTVSKSEYRKIMKGMSKKKVAKKVGHMHNDGYGWYSRPSTTSRAPSGFTSTSTAR